MTPEQASKLLELQTEMAQALSSIESSLLIISYLIGLLIGIEIGKRIWK